MQSNEPQGFSAKDLVLLEALLAQEQEPVTRKIPLAMRDGLLPASFAQQRLWFAYLLAENTAAYHVPLLVRLVGPFSLSRLQASIDEIIRRHETLRTTFQIIEDQLIQIVNPPYTCPLPIIDCSEIAETITFQQVRAEVKRPFDLTSGPVLRAIVWRVADQEHIFLLTIHHIAIDAWSQRILIQELLTLYDADHHSSHLPELPIQYADFSLWQRQTFAYEELQEQGVYWREHLAGMPLLLELPLNYPRPSTHYGPGATQKLHFSPQVSRNLKAFSQREGVSPFMLLLAVLQVLLARYTGRDDIVVGAPVANRTHQEIANLIGFFVNMLILRTDTAGNPPFRTMLKRVREVTLAAYKHQEFPFEKIVEELLSGRNPGYHPLIQILLIFDEAAPEPRNLTPLRAEILELQPESAVFDLIVRIWDTGQHLDGRLEYRTDLFEAATMERLSANFQTLLESAIIQPEQRIASLPLLSAAERRQLLTDWNATAADFPSRSGIHQLFEEQVRRTPEKIAVIYNGAHLTYQAFNARANQLAHALQRRVQPGKVVGLYCERSLEMVILGQAVLKVGCGYCPLDPHTTLERILLMIQDSQIELVLVHPSTMVERLASYLANSQTRIVTLAGISLAEESRENVSVALDGETPAYVMYTSGSTGRPKGVLLPHRVLTNLIYWHTSSLLGGVRILQHSSLSFDSSVHEMFVCWTSGGTLIILPEQARADVAGQVTLLEEEAIEKAIFPAMLLQHIIGIYASAERGDSLKEIITTGEQLSISQAVREFFAARPTCRLHNHYGPSETHVVTAYALPKNPGAWSSSPSIGYPIANTQVYLLDAYMQIAPLGAVGEIYLGGANLGHGYLGQTALTAERFVPNPFSSRPGERLYRTGDLAQYQQDGSILYLGRIDQQVKIRGYRVEPGELEAALYRHPDVREVVVQAQHNEAGERQLVAYIVPNPQRSPFIEGYPRLMLPNGLAVTYTVKSEIEALYQEIFEEHAHTPPWITIADGDLIVDVGAHIGLFSLFLALQGKQVTIYAFEPIPVLNQRLRLNTMLYDANIKIFEYGLSDRNGVAPFTYYPQASVWSGMYADSGADSKYFKMAVLNTQQIESAYLDALLDGRFEGETVHCSLRTLSSIIREHGIKQIDLLKVDVERSELDVLEGIEEEDWSKIRQCVVEVHDSGHRVEHLQRLFAQKGFAVTIQQSPMLAGTDMYHLYAARSVLSYEKRDAFHSTSVERPSFLSAEELRHFLSQIVPDYLLPAALVFRESMPLTPNGKVDRKALPPVTFDRTAFATPYEEPHTETEKQLVGLWEQNLHLSQQSVGIRDNYFNLGGHSISVIRLLALIRDHYAIELVVRDLFDHPTVMELAEYIETIQLATPQTIPDGQHTLRDEIDI